jgi:hypothetical protein
MVANTGFFKLTLVNHMVFKGLVSLNREVQGLAMITGVPSRTAPALGAKT